MVSLHVSTGESHERSCQANAMSVASVAKRQVGTSWKPNSALSSAVACVSFRSRMASMAVHASTIGWMHAGSAHLLAAVMYSCPSCSVVWAIVADDAIDPHTRSGYLPRIHATSAPGYDHEYRNHGVLWYLTLAGLVTF